MPQPPSVPPGTRADDCALTQLPDDLHRAAGEFSATAERILQDQRLAPPAKTCWLQAAYQRAVNRLKKADEGKSEFDLPPLNQIFKAFAARIADLPAQELSPAEYRAMHWLVKAADCSSPLSGDCIPHSGCRAVQIPRLAWELMDGKRSLYECICMADAAQDAPTPAKRFAPIMEELQCAARCGYASITKQEPVLTSGDFAAALQKLGVVRGMKLVVHSTASALGRVPEGMAALCRTLQEAIGPEGTLMMPSFTFQLYRPGKKGVLFDVANTPSKTGILTETFRNMPGVVRSFDPCHAYCVWGKDARKYVEKHHLVPTVDPLESPLGLLHRDGGYALTIASAAAVTFMHVVEAECGARCCGKRAEEYDALLPNGETVKLRTWSWRQTTCPECPAGRTDEIVDEMRKSGQLREVQLNDARLLLFPLALYRTVYAALMKKNCRNLARPRHAETAVAGDWDEKSRSVSPSTDAYTGPWMAADAQEARCVNI